MTFPRNSTASSIFSIFPRSATPAWSPSALTSALGLSSTSDDPVPALLAYVQNRRILLVLDSCEHLIEAVANLTERMFAEAAGLHFLATSREAMRVEGEHVYPLEGLSSPPADMASASQILQFPAVQLFVERATASLGHFVLTDADAVTVAAICDRLDGMALAIELAAGRVGTYGVFRRRLPTG